MIATDVLLPETADEIESLRKSCAALQEFQDIATDKLNVMAEEMAAQLDQIITLRTEVKRLNRINAMFAGGQLTIMKLAEGTVNGNA